MTDYQIVSNEQERAFLVGAVLKGSRPLFHLDDSLSELELLAKTAGIEVVGKASQQVQQIDPATFIGTGKVEEIRDEVEALDAQVVIFDDELSPRHQRELEKRFGEKVKILDRSALILDIFAQHAHTREGALQVELAQYEYRLPRLTRQWTHLARQAGGGGARGGSGGVGLRGPGETQLEVDRREISRKITKLKDELEQVRAHRSRHRAQRVRAKIPVISLVGYTNAGKSTLFRSLTGSDVYVADQLFATLDPTTRRISLPGNLELLISDTVGFIQKLPTTLVAAFRATLEEITEAELLLHIVDISHVNALQHIESVEDTLAEIDASTMPRILVLNKVDRLRGNIQIPTEISDQYDASVTISAKTGMGLDELMLNITQVLSQNFIFVELCIPYDKGADLSALYELGHVLSKIEDENGWRIKVRLPKKLYNQYETYQTT